MGDLPKDFLAFLAGLGLPMQVYLGILTVLFLLGSFKLYDSGADRKRWTGYLIQDRGRTFYTRKMTKTLDWLDNKLSGSEAKTYPEDHPRRAWSWGLINLTMMIALAYPVLALLMQWLITGEGRLGGTEVIPTAGWFIRSQIGAGLAISLCLYLYAAKTKSRLRLPSFITVTAILLVGSVFYSNDLGAVALAVPFAVALAVTFAFAVPFAFAFAEKKFGVSWWGRSIYFGLLLIILSGVIKYLPSLVTNAGADQLPVFILFLCILPIFNGFADFGSIGLTRYLLRRGVIKGRAPWWGIGDVFAGGAIFAILAALVIAWIGYVHPIDNVPLIDLQALFNSIRANPHDYWWLGFMFASTLIPTLLHGFIATCALLTAVPEWIRRPLVAGLVAGGKGEVILGRLSSAVLSLGVAFAFWLPFYALYFIVTMNHGAVMFALVDCAEWFARFIGAL